MDNVFILKNDELMVELYKNQSYLLNQIST